MNTLQLNIHRSRSTQGNTYIPIIVTLGLLILPLNYVIAILYTFIFLFYLQINYPLFKGPLENMLWLSFFLRIALVFANHAAPFLPTQSDTILFSHQAMRIVENVSNKLPLFYNFDYSLSVKSYSLFLSLFYRFLGEQILLASLINSFLGLLSAVLVYKISIIAIKDEKSALLAGGFVLFWPSIVVFTSYALRDSIIFYSTVRFLYHSLGVIQKKNLRRNTIFALLSLLIVGIFRIQNLYLYALLLIFYLLIFLFVSNGKRLLKLALATVLILVILLIIKEYKTLLNLVITYPMRAQPLRAVGESAYLQNVQYLALLDVFRFLPLRFTYFTFGPFIWDANGLFLFLASLEGFSIMLATIMALTYLVKIRKLYDKKVVNFLLLFCFAGLLANSTVDSNFGTVVRHRFIYVSILIVFTSASLRNLRIKLA